MNKYQATDNITQVMYYNVSDINAVSLFKDMINKDNFFIGIYQNQSRFLTKNNTLVKVASVDVLNICKLLEIANPPSLDNYVNFDIALDHAYLNFKCEVCDDGYSLAHNYDFINQIQTSKFVVYIKSDIYDGFESVQNINQSHHLYFYLNNEQAQDMLGAINAIKEDKSYKYISDARDCVGFLKDVSVNAKMQKFSLYYQDEELIQPADDTSGGYPDLGSSAFTHKYYNFMICQDPTRALVGNFIESIYGEDFRDRWNDIQQQNLNITLAADNEFILSRIQEIHDNSREVYNFAIERYSNFSAAQQEECVNYLTNNHELAYHELYNFENAYYTIGLINYFSQFSYYDKISHFIEFESEEFIKSCMEYLDIYSSANEHTVFI